VEIKVILEGPENTGKSALARAIHKLLCKGEVDAGFDGSVKYPFTTTRQAVQRLIDKHTTVMISERNISSKSSDPIPKPDRCDNQKLKQLLFAFAQNARTASKIGDDIAAVPGFDEVLRQVNALQSSSYNHGACDRSLEQQREDEGRQKIAVKPEYLSLFRVLEQALSQAQNGKGAQRHNMSGTTPFEKQRMQTVSELIGSPDGMVYQAIKKLTEGMKLPTLERQTAELLGVINYVAGIIVYLHAHQTETKAEGKAEGPSQDWTKQLAAQEAKYQAIHEHNERVRAAAAAREQSAQDIMGALSQRASELFPGLTFEQIFDLATARQISLKAAAIQKKAGLPDPVDRVYPVVMDTGWTAIYVAELFAVLHKLNKKLSRNPGRISSTESVVVEAHQLLGRVWRHDSPILKAIDSLSEQINTVARGPHGKPYQPENHPV